MLYRGANQGLERLALSSRRHAGCQDCTGRPCRTRCPGFGIDVVKIGLETVAGRTSQI